MNRRDTAGAMSEENIELVRAFPKIWNDRNMEGVQELFDPDAVLEVAPDWPEQGPFIGRDAVMGQLNRARATFESDSVEWLGDPVAIGDQVIVRLAWHGLGQGPRSSMQWTAVFTVRHGLFSKLQYFWDHDEALEATRLPE
jgi:ketosteroid isomerase-like protein